MIEKAASFIRQSTAMLLGTGAGFGVDSGLPDFRGKEGFWKNYPPYRGKFSFMQCANPGFLQQHPHLFWGFYGSRLNMYRQTTPHQGYSVLRELGEELMGGKLFVVTSNVDGHFQKANYSPQSILEVHGSINHLQCYDCNLIESNNFEPKVDLEKMSSKTLATCSKCGRLSRPNILMFDDWEWLSDRTEEQEKNYKTFLERTKGEKMVIVEVGAGTGVPTIRLMMEEVYNRHPQSRFIRINPDKMISSSSYMAADRYVDVHLPALQAIQEIQRLL